MASLGRPLDELGHEDRLAVLIPEPSLRFRWDMFRTVTSDRDGQFEMHGVAPGEYKVFAWEGVDEGVWHDPAFLEKFENKGQKLTVTAKAVTTVSVDLAK